MRGSTTSVALLCSFALGLPVQAGQADGNAWRTFDPASKVAYVTGFRDAMAACRAFATTKLNNASLAENERCRVLIGTDDNKAIALVLKVVPSQLQDGLDQFYQDATNRLITVPRALGLIFMRLTGSSEQDLKEMLEFERAAAASLR